MAEERQRFVGDVERQLGLTCGAGLFLPFDALYQQHDKTDADAAEDHRNTDLRDNIQPQRDSRGPDDHQNHGQRFAQHARDDPGAPVLLFRYFAVNPAGKNTGDDAGDKTGHRRHAANIYQVTMRPGNQAGNNAHPGAKQDPAGHHGNNPHVNQRPFYRHSGPGTEQGEQ